MDNALQRYMHDTGRPISFAKGEIIARAHDEPQHIFYIEAGYVKVYSLNDNGEQYVHIVYAPGELFPLGTIISNAPTTVFYSAFTDCSVLRIGFATIDEAMREDIDLTHDLLNLAVVQFRLYSSRIDNLQYKYARERLVYCLLFLAGRFGSLQDDGSYVLQAPFTQQLIGDMINVSRESVSREFDRLRGRQMIAYQGPFLQITDWRELSKEFKEPIHAEWWNLR